MAQKERDENMDDEEEDDIIELEDEDGNTIRFKLLDVTEYKGVKYTLLIAAEPDENYDENDVFVFRLNEKEQTLECIDDNDTLQEVFDFYISEVGEEDDGPLEDDGGAEKAEK